MFWHRPGPVLRLWARVVLPLPYCPDLAALESTVATGQASCHNGV